MRQYFANILKGKTRLNPVHPIFILLHILSLPYLLIVKARISLYKTGVFKTNRLKCPVISVGNLTLGGTGKTPVVEYIARVFMDKGFKPVVLTRGYGRSPKFSIAIVSNGENILLKQEEAGDEPYLLARNNPSLPVIVGKNRYQAGKTAIKNFNPNVIILDDGFQHLSIDRDLNIVLLNSICPLGNGYIFPAGFLREPVSSLKRADIILYTHSDESTDNDCENLLLKEDVPKFRTTHAFEKIVCMKDKKVISPEELNKKKVVAFCGIGESDSFKNKIELYGAEVIYYKFYPDHYVYRLSDLQFIHGTAEKLKADLILTTQKDGVKIKDMASAFPLIWTVRMKIKFVEGEDKFQEVLLSCISQLS